MRKAEQILKNIKHLGSTDNAKFVKVNQGQQTVNKFDLAVVFKGDGLLK